MQGEQHPFRAGLLSQTRRKVTKNRDDLAAVQRARDEVNKLVLDHGPWATERFHWVGLIINLVATPDEVAPEPIVRRISKGELPVIVDAHVEPLRGLEAEQLVTEYKRLMLRGLIAGLQARGEDVSFAVAALANL